MAAEPESRSQTLTLAGRGAAGGVLMGLANLVPGISGGTVLLAVGVYPQFIAGVAEVTRLRFKARSLVLLGCVVGGAVAAIAALAGAMKTLVVEHRWAAFSLFIGLTLGAVPLLWKMARPVGATIVRPAIIGFAVMIATVVFEPASIGGATGGEFARTALLVVAGIAGGAAMILPGVSGSYLLLVLGQYVVILGAIESAGDAAADRDWAQVAEEMRIFIPVAAGVVIGVVGVANIVKVCLDRFPAGTPGFLLGLVLGAVVGLWPFQQPVNDAAGAVERMELVAPPGFVPAAMALALLIVGFALSTAVSRLGRPTEPGGE